MEGDYSAENIKEQLWTEGLQEIFELRFKKGASLIKQCKPIKLSRFPNLE